MDPAEKILARLASVERFIKWRARIMAFGDPAIANDLAQEARLFVWKKLQENPDLPFSFICQLAKEAVYKYRRRGFSVDRLFLERRKRHYYFVSYEKIDDWLPLSGRSMEDVILRRLILNAFWERLTPVEQTYLELRVAGYSQTEIQQKLGFNLYYQNKLRHTIRERKGNYD